MSLNKIIEKNNHYFVIFILLLYSSYSPTTSFSSHIFIYRVYSENNQFYLKSSPFYNNTTTLLGESIVSRSSDSSELYRLNRSFILDDTWFIGDIFLSNDGKKIAYLNKNFNDSLEKNTLVFYNNGKLIKDYGLKELIDCNNDIEDCSLFNFLRKDIFKRDTSDKKVNFIFLPVHKDTILGRIYYKLKDSISELEKFSVKYKAFIKDDIVYIINSKNRVLQFDINTGEKIGDSSIYEIYEKIKDKGRYNKFEFVEVKSPSSYTLPKLSDGFSFYSMLVKNLDVKFCTSYDTTFFTHSIRINSLIDTNGTFELINIKNNSPIKDSVILRHLENVKFEKNKLPNNISKWYYTQSISFRNKSDSIAKYELDEFYRTLDSIRNWASTADTMHGMYIPKDIYDCFKHLDILLPQKAKKFVDSIPNMSDMNSWHMGYGMWIRNAWGLWGYSRLYVYFLNLGVSHPDNISGIIFDGYFKYRHKENFDLEELLKIYKE